MPELSTEVCSQLQKLMLGLVSSSQNQASQIWAAYMAMPHEVSVQTLWDQSYQSKIGDEIIHWALPNVQTAPQKRLEFWLPGAAGLEPGYAGILEPAMSTAVTSTAEVDARQAQLIPLAEIAAVLVPGLGFDRQGVRLGHGQGFYDRTLSGYNGFKIGVTREVLLVDELPSDANDVKMNFVVTEKGVYKIS